MSGSLAGGTSLTEAEKAWQEQWNTLHHIVDHAYRLMPAGFGQGDGPTPAQVDQVVRVLLLLYEMTGEGRALYEWLGVALCLDQEEAQVQASLAIRDYFMSVEHDDDEDMFPDVDENRDAEDALIAAAVFATVPEKQAQ